MEGEHKRLVTAQEERRRDPEEQQTRRTRVNKRCLTIAVFFILILSKVTRGGFGPDCRSARRRRENEQLRAQVELQQERNKADDDSLLPSAPPPSYSEAVNA